MNSRTKYIGKIFVTRKPSKKFLKLQGKTAYDKYTNRVYQSVWKREIKIKDGIKYTEYSIYKCNNVIIKDNEEIKCNGYLEYDKNGYKICNCCGLGLKDNEYSTELYNIINKDVMINNYYGSTNGYIKKIANTNDKDESIKLRNSLWNDLKCDKFIFKNDRGAEKIIKAYKNIKNFEEGIKNEQ